MTGTLVKLGKRNTAASLGDALWGAVAIMAMLTGVASRIDFAHFAGGLSGPPRVTRRTPCGLCIALIAQQP